MKMSFAITLLALSLVLMASATFGNELPWADGIIHTHPCLERGLGPEMITPGYCIQVLTATGRDGQVVDHYDSWTAGPGGHKVYCKFRPGEPVEARNTGYREIQLNGKNYLVKTWEAKRLVRCGNPTEISFYQWFEVRTKTKIVEKTVEKCVPATTNPVNVNVQQPAVVVNTPPQTNVYNNYNNNVSYNLASSVYPSAQMGGCYGATVSSMQLMGVCATQYQKINISANNNTNTANGGEGGHGGNVCNTNNNTNTNSNANANNNVVNTDGGHACGTATATGTAKN